MASNVHARTSFCRLLSETSFCACQAKYLWVYLTYIHAVVCVFIVACFFVALSVFVSVAYLTIIPFLTREYYVGLL